MMLRGIYIFLVLVLALLVSGCGQGEKAAAQPEAGSYQWENFYWDERPVIVTLNVEDASDEWQEAVEEAAYWWEHDSKGLVEFQITSLSDADVIIHSGDYPKSGDIDWAGLTNMYAEDWGALGYGDMKLNDKFADEYRHPEDYRLATACHELGHTLGLGHSVGVKGCMHESVAGLYPGETDLMVLEKMYG